MKFIVSAGVILFRINQGIYEYLLLRYRQGHWDLPKGKIEKNESKEQAAIRELKEEAGVSCELYKDFEEKFDYFFKLDDVLIKKTVYFFLGKALNGNIVISDEHVEYSWLGYQEAFNQLTFNNAKEVLKKANDFLQKK